MSCLNAETFSFNHTLYPQLQLDSTNFSHHSLKKRLALSQTPDDVSPPKRLCESMANATNSISYIDSVSSSFTCDCLSSIFPRNDKVVECGAPPELTGLAATGDLDDVLDLLLQGANAMPGSAMCADVNNIGLATMVKTQLGGAPKMQGLISPHEMEEHCKTPEEIDSKPCDKILPTVPQCIFKAEYCLDDVNVKIKHATEHMQQGIENILRTSCEEWWTRQRPSTYTELFSAQQVQPNQGGEIISPAVSAARSGGSRWVGPTLMDIESALALTSSPTISNYPPLVSPPALPKAPYQLAGSCLQDILHQETTSFLTTSSSNFCKEDQPTVVEEDDTTMWRRLRKRNHQMEPRYTVQIRSEEDAVNDGYRWRKYGQKSIKNSPHPRSYYRCSSGACGVKKQVERSRDDAELLLVSYEGIHLHHRPCTPLLPHTYAAPLMATCESGPSPSTSSPLPTTTFTADNSTPFPRTSSTTTL
ncbi:hypothetical protein L7F22_046614 [Adiantum nelumboides]|nr:hypothetical protein [Adiantum nelumboides]